MTEITVQSLTEYFTCKTFLLIDVISNFIQIDQCVNINITPRSGIWWTTRYLPDIAGLLINTKILNLHGVIESLLKLTYIFGIIRPKPEQILL